MGEMDGDTVLEYVALPLKESDTHAEGVALTDDEAQGEAGPLTDGSSKVAAAVRLTVPWAVVDGEPVVEVVAVEVTVEVEVPVVVEVAEVVEMEEAVVVAVAVDEAVEVDEAVDEAVEVEVAIEVEEAVEEAEEVAEAVAVDVAEEEEEEKVTTRTLFAAPSDTYRPPALVVATPCGLLNCALVPTPCASPYVEEPARVVTTPELSVPAPMATWRSR